MDFWTAFDAVEPIGEQRLQTAETNVLLERHLEFQAAAFGQRYEPSTIERHMPPRYRSEEKRKPPIVKQDAKTEFASLAAAFGLKEIVDIHGRIDKLS